MNRILLVLLLFLGCFSACTKSNDVAAQVKAQGVIDDKLVTSYLNKQGLPINHVDTSGVCYIIDAPGTGTALFTSSTQVTLSYTGTLLQTDGTLGVVFANTDTVKVHASYPLGGVIRGWQLGIPKIKTGGQVTLYVPSRYAYGPYAQATLGLPANAVLIFHITLYNIIN